MLFSALSLALITIALYLSEYIVTWELEGLVYTFAIACIAIPIHLFAKKKEFLYVISWAMNSFGTGLGISSYYKYNETVPDLLQTALVLAVSLLLLVAVCLLLYKFKESKTIVIRLFSVILALLAVTSIVFWIIDGSFVYSFSFFCLIQIAVWLFVCAITVNVPKRHILRDISFGGFGIAIIAGVTVLSLVTEEDCGVEFLGEGVAETLGMNSDAKRKRR